jgi:hypothetical protein
MKLTREETKKRAALIASVIPGSTVVANAWNITVVTRGGKHVAIWVGRKDGFTKVEWAR